MVRKSFIKLLTVSSLVLLLGACSIFPKAPQMTVYPLPQRDVQRHSTVAVDKVLSVATPYAISYLDTNRIVVMTPQHSLAVMEGIRWDDLGPIVFRDSLISSLRRANIYSAVINDGTGVGDYSLRSDLQDFQMDYSVQPAEAVISIDATLISLKARSQAYKTASFTARAALSAESDEAVVNAFADANQQLQQQLIQWLSTQPLP
ncbi:MAG: hypothetical protein GX860_04710 [Alcaligenaceae bacterium]|jgi:cholesterol transport system auxiliary component|nr:hypothetical protein [Alcaligenaceae bacterium]